MRRCRASFSLIGSSFRSTSSFGPRVGVFLPCCSAVFAVCCSVCCGNLLRPTACCALPLAAPCRLLRICCVLLRGCCILLPVCWRSPLVRLHFRVGIDSRSCKLRHYGILRVWLLMHVSRVHLCIYRHKLRLWHRQPVELLLLQHIYSRSRTSLFDSIQAHHFTGKRMLLYSLDLR